MPRWSSGRKCDYWTKGLGFDFWVGQSYTVLFSHRVWICARYMAIGSPSISWDLKHKILLKSGCTLYSSITCRYVHLCLLLRGLKA
ncbi:hypothetical protein SFRURICE_014792 [Spodoptera frugiperda]|nr:hypothetical protein SFRURICE_014792 [Spodoptera frugiperda]